MKKRYKLREDQLERIVESFINESAAPEATKHIVKKEGGDKMMELGDGVKEPSEKDPEDGLSQAPEAKKHIQNKMGGKMTELGKGVKKPSEKMVMKKSQAGEAKKHVKGTK
jgi:hypothetical protein